MANGFTQAKYLVNKCADAHSNCKDCRLKIQCNTLWDWLSEHDKIEADDLKKFRTQFSNIKRELAHA